MAVHKDLTGADLHEPKGADTATSGKVYVSDGAGSGVWTTATSIITNTAFTTGDLKPTYKTTADTSWIMWVPGSIGSSSSAATVRANADTADLFTLFWTNMSDAACPVSGGRGASAAADFAAHKRLTLPLGVGCSLSVAGTAAGLTSRALGVTTGAETTTLAANQIPALSGITGSNSISVTFAGRYISASSNVQADVSVPTTGGVAARYAPSGAGDWANISSASGTNSITVAYPNASQQTVSLMHPSVFVNVMIKL